MVQHTQHTHQLVQQKHTDIGKPQQSAIIYSRSFYTILNPFALGWPLESAREI